MFTRNTQDAEEHQEGTSAARQLHEPPSAAAGLGFRFRGFRAEATEEKALKSPSPWQNGIYLSLQLLGNLAKHFLNGTVCCPKKELSSLRLSDSRASITPRSRRRHGGSFPG